MCFGTHQMFVKTLRKLFLTVKRCQMGASAPSASFGIWVGVRTHHGYRGGIEDSDVGIVCLWL